MIRITKICMSDGYNDLQHITHLYWEQDGNDRKGWATRRQVIEWIERDGFRFYVKVAGSRSEVIVAGTGTSKYLRTTPNNTTRDNLLSLPTYTNSNAA